MITRRVAVRGIIFKDGKLFCQKLRAKNSTGVNAFWSTPGGGLDPGEGLIDGLKREMIEETGIKPVVGELLFMQQFAENDKEHLEFFFHIKNVDDYNAIELEKTAHGLLEVNDMKFVDPASETILPAFLRTKDIQSTIEQQGSVEIISYL
jgi:ADP-ribose pyrophosphatase YjhB (NUDIX family)